MQKDMVMYVSKKHGIVTVLQQYMQKNHGNTMVNNAMVQYPQNKVLEWELSK